MIMNYLIVIFYFEICPFLFPFLFDFDFAQINIVRNLFGYVRHKISRTDNSDVIAKECLNVGF